MKLEVGMYIRFKDKRNNQYIRKITSVNTEEPEKRYAGIYVDKVANNVYGVSLKNIIGKPTYNITDLIEVGDIILLEIADDYACEFFIDIYMMKNEDNLLHLIEEIKKPNVRLLRIMTKEQFENNCYKVGD